MQPIDRMRPQEWIAGLNDLCARFLTRESVVVEIGSFGGESTAVFAQHAGTVHAIDPWPATYAADIVAGCESREIRDYVSLAGVADMARVEAMFDARVKGYPHVRKWKAQDADVVHQFADASVDLVYIDSIHTYEVVRAAIRRWYPKVKPAGVCAGHDYLPPVWPGVVAAVNEAFGPPPFLFRDTSWAIPKAQARLRQSGNGVSIQTPV